MSFTEVALAVLYLLQEAKIPLSIEQISHALSATSEYTYLDAAISANNLLEKNLIIKASSKYALPLFGFAAIAFCAKSNACILLLPTSAVAML